MCYIQVSEHLGGQAAGASMQQGGESQMSSMNIIEPSMLPSFKLNV